MGIYFISDTHFDHYNIIRYCKRPFNSVKQMNDTIIDNWNSVVSDFDTVFFLGDLAMNRFAYQASDWFTALNGKIIAIRGSHDRFMNYDLVFSNSLIYHRGQSFILIHDPYYVRNNLNGWVIHGHLHNNHMDRYPFINGIHKTINVSVELIGYKPVSLDQILNYNLDTVKRVRLLGDLPERF